VTEAFGARGGLAQYNRDFLGALANSGCFASITVLPRLAGESASLPRRVEQTRPPRGRVSYAGAAVSAAMVRSVDVVFCGHIHLAPLAAAIARLKGARLVMQVHGIEIWAPLSALWRAALESSDMVLCVSRHTRAAVLDAAALAPERVVVVPNTVRDAFTPGDGRGFRAAHELGGRRVLLTVARMDKRERYKGHDRVISAIPKLVARGHDIAYVVVGSGDDRPRLEMLAGEAGVTERVRFVGELTPEALIEAYRAADLFVMPSTGEGFGISFLEAMACGRPALGLPVGGARDALGDGHLGTMVEEPELCAAIDRILSGPAQRPEDLAGAVRARFGRDLFSANIRAAFARIGFEAGA
jgi:phosphatidylinositol alpha-1,6-mannosyltransferase